MNFNKYYIIKVGLLSLFTLSSFHTIANDDNSSNNSSSYPVSFFIQYHPQNAFEMIKRLPGFSFDGGSRERGFGGNAGNVLIDGARPTAKSGGLRSALIRIPLAQVEKIEIIRGSQGTSETSGQSIVANIVRKKDITSGTWTFKLRRAPDGDLRPNLEAAITTKIGTWDTAFDTDIGGWVGYRTALLESKNGNDTLTESANEILDQKNSWMFVNGQGSQKFSRGKLSLNGRIGGNKSQDDAFRHIFYASESSPQANEYWQLNESNANKELELGVDWLGNDKEWKWHVLGLTIVKNRVYKNTFHNQIFTSSELTDSNFKQERLKTEYIFRNTYGKIGNEKFKPEYGFEIANNKLDTDLQYFENNQEQMLDVANVIVDELRAEVFANFTYSASNYLSIEGGLTAEFSTIEVTGDAFNKQDFQFLKPRLSATYNVNSDLQFSLLAEHNVGQLNFNDFAASNNAADDRNTAGNPNLKPDQTTQLSAKLDWGFSEKGSLSVNIFHKWRIDILENIIVTSSDGNVSHALGNAGDATFWGFESELNLPLDSVVPKGLLVFSYNYNRSKYFDAIINNHRIINYYTPKEFNIEFRQDFVEHKFAWGVEFESHFTNSHYLVDEFVTFKGNNRLEVFVESTYFDGLKVQLQVRDLNRGEFERSRFFYENDRSGAYEGSEVSKRERRPELKLSVWGTF